MRVLKAIFLFRYFFFAVRWAARDKVKLRRSFGNAITLFMTYYTYLCMYVCIGIGRYIYFHFHIEVQFYGLFVAAPCLALSRYTISRSLKCCKIGFIPIAVFSHKVISMGVQINLFSGKCFEKCMKAKPYLNKPFFLVVVKKFWRNL